MFKLGVEPHKGICIIGFNSPEWFFANLGAIGVGAIAAGIYTTNGPDACEYVASHCEAQLIFVENEVQLKKFLQIRDKLPNVKKLIQWSGEIPTDTGDYVISWKQFMEIGADVPDEEIEKLIEFQKPSNCCTLIYTSGTTGSPKAVMISHDNATWTSRAAIDLLGITEADSLISYLPLSHIAAQMLDIHGPLSVGASVYFAQPDALKGSLPQTLKEVKPTAFLGVPRVWEKIQEKMSEVGKKTTGLKKTISTWARGKGLEGNYSIQRGGDVPWGWWFADHLVFQKVKEALGLQNCRFCATAAAPIAKETLDYFLALNIPIYEIYGMSECTGPQTINRPGKVRTGTAGPSIPGTELKIADPDKDGNGEICYKGRHIFLGYMKNPKATAETFDEDGFLHSGDVGRVDKDGFLTITGRIKELIITAGGENVPPVLIEDEIKIYVGDLVSNIMVVGDRRKFLSALFTLRLKPKPNPAPGEYPFTDELLDSTVQFLQKNGIEVTKAEEAVENEKVREIIQKAIQAANKKATSNAQCVQKFKIVPNDFTVEGNELTPTLKLKRRIVSEKYSQEIEGLYAV